MAQCRRREGHLEPQLGRQTLGLLVEHEEEGLAAGRLHAIDHLLVAEEVVADLLDRVEGRRRVVGGREDPRMVAVERVVEVEEAEAPHPAVDPEQVEGCGGDEPHRSLVGAEETPDRRHAAEDAVVGPRPPRSRALRGSGRDALRVVDHAPALGDRPADGRSIIRPGRLAQDRRFGLRGFHGLPGLCRLRRRCGRLGRRLPGRRSHRRAAQTGGDRRDDRERAREQHAGADSHTVTPHQSRTRSASTCAVVTIEGRCTRSSTPWILSASGPQHTAGIPEATKTRASVVAVVTIRSGADPVTASCAEASASTIGASAGTSTPWPANPS